MAMDKARQLDRSKVEPFKAGVVENDNCTSMQHDKWRNLPFLQDLKPTDCFFADETEEDLVAVFLFELRTQLFLVDEIQRI